MIRGPIDGKYVELWGIPAWRRKLGIGDESETLTQRIESIIAGTANGGPDSGPGSVDNANARLAAFATLEEAGYVVQTSTFPPAFAGRQIVGVPNRINVTNGTGINGNTVLQTPQDIHAGATPSFQTIKPTLLNNDFVTYVDSAGELASTTITATALETAVASASAMDILTTLGDLLTHDGSSYVRLPIGTDDQFLRVNGTSVNWETVAAASFPHTLLDTTIHTDTATAAVSRGSVIVGNATPAWFELTIGGAGTVLSSDGTDVSWQLAVVVTPAALTRTDDTNVTLTLGGSPTVALLAATSLTLGWTGQLSVARGGTNAASFTAGSVIFAGAGGTSLAQDNANFFWDDTSNRLGIGTAAPQELLHIGAGTDASAISTTDLLVTRAGASSLGVRDSLNNVEGNIYCDANGVQIGSFTVHALRLMAGGTEVVRMVSVGNVGIGNTTWGTSAVRVVGLFNGTAPTTSPADVTQWWSADRGGTAGKASLHVRSEDGTSHVFGDRVGLGTVIPGDQLEVTASAGQGILVGATASGNTGGALRSATTNFGLDVIGVGFGAIYGKIEFIQTLGSLATPLTRMIIENDGNVGIGTGASAPTVLLDLGLAGTKLGVIRLAGSTSGNVTIQPAVVAGTWTLTLPPNDGTAGQVLQTDGAGVATWETPSGGTIGPFTAGSVIFSDGVTPLAEDNANFFWDDATNRLGIGTAVPDYRLDVRGSGNDSVSAAIQIRNTIALGNTSASAFLNLQTIDSGGFVAAYPSDFVVVALQDRMVVGSLLTASGTTIGAFYAGQDVRFYAGNFTTVRAIINSTGLGVGNSAPGALLDVGLAGTTAGVIRLAGATSGNVTIQTDPAAGSWTLTLPVDDGNSGNMLITDGNGVTSWISPTTVVPAALTRVDDTNITLTLGGSPSTALLAATSITAGWTGVLSIARGGTNANNFSTSNGVVYYDGTSLVTDNDLILGSEGLVLGYGTTKASALAVNWSAASAVGTLALSNLSTSALAATYLFYDLADDSANVYNNVAQIIVGKVQNWTSTASTRDAYLTIYADVNGADTQHLSLQNANIICGDGTDLAQGAVNGFLYLPRMSPGILSAPTGTPTAYAGQIPCVIDEDNSTLWAYIGGSWKGVLLA